MQENTEKVSTESSTNDPHFISASVSYIGVCVCIFVCPLACSG